MKQLLLLTALMCLPVLAMAQTTEKQYYIYNIITFSGNLKVEGFIVFVDDGKEIKKLKDDSGKTVKFNTPAAALMHFISRGWELYVSGATSTGAMYSGLGAVESTSYWIIRKPCTKEDFEQAVKDGIRK